MIIQFSSLEPDFAKVVEDAIHDTINGVGLIADPGVAVAVIKGGELVFSGGFGFRDRGGAGKKVDADTCFAIGSATKAFTSMAVSMLVEDRKISLETPIKQLLPDFQMKDAQATSEMTLLDILCHRTGLPLHNALWYLGPFTRSQLLYRLRYLEPFPVAGGTAFRTKFLYNNIMYMVAGQLLEILFGDSYENIVKTRILDPLGMTATSFSLADLTGRTNYAKGYEQAAELPLKDFTNIGPAAEINSNVVDMTKWVLLFLRKGLGPDGSTVMISQAALEKMYTIFTYPDDGTHTGYGLGWTIGTIQDNRRLVFHTGDADGNSSYVSFMPDDGLGVIVLTNQHCADGMINAWPDKVARNIYDHLLHGSVTGKLSLPLRMAPRAAFYAANAAPLAAPVVAPPVSPGDCTGMFSNPGYGDLVVSRSGSNLNISYYGLTWPLRPVVDMDFQFMVHAFGTNFPVFVRFAKGSTGSIDSFSASFVRPPVPLVQFLKR
jgi:CubicO group peptidase (beta-lactamase class C family)